MGIGVGGLWLRFTHFVPSKPWHLVGLTIVVLLMYAAIWAAFLWLWNRSVADLKGRSLRRLALDAGLLGLVILFLFIRSGTAAQLACVAVASLIWQLTRTLRQAGESRLGRVAGWGLCALIVLVVFQAASLDLPTYWIRAPVHDVPGRRRQDPGHLMVGMAISGGGSRAAYFASAFLRDLADLAVVSDPGGDSSPRERPWLEEIDAVVGVSGGSLVAGRLTQILGEAGRPAPGQDTGSGLARLIGGMHAEMGRPFVLEAFVRRATKGLFLQPLFGYTMTDGLKDSFERAIFHGARLTDLPGKPVLSIPATDLVTGLTVRYTQAGMIFEDGLEPVAPEASLAEACVASSAVPGLLPGLEIAVCHKALPLTGCVDLRFHRLADGGIVDNLGLSALQAVMFGLHAGRPCGFRGAMFLVIDAAPVHLRKEHCFDGAAVTRLRFGSAPQDRETSRIDQFRDSFEILYRSAQTEVLCRHLAGFAPLEPGRDMQSPRPSAFTIKGMTYHGEASPPIFLSTIPAVALVNLQAAGYLLAEQQSGESRWFSEASMQKIQAAIERLKPRNEVFSAEYPPELARRLDRAASSIRANYYLSSVEREILDFIALVWAEFYRAPIVNWFEQARQHPLPCRGEATPAPAGAARMSGS